jgi:hypothetical protein
MNDGERLIEAAETWFETATFKDATVEQIRTLLDSFDIQAGRRLTDLECEALVELQHNATTAKVLMQGVLSGRLAVGRGENGFLYSAR